MSNSLSIKDIKSRHYSFITQAANENLELSHIGKTVFDNKRNEVDELIKDMEEFSKNKISVADYQWLSQAAIQWQMIYVSIFNTPKSIKIAPPSLDISKTPPNISSLTSDEVINWIKTVASIRGRMRMRLLGRVSTKEEMQIDWRYAHAVFATEVLDGKINFASRISSTEYPILENEWIKHIKCTRAYYNWEKRGWQIDINKEMSDYNEACRHIRGMLVEKNIKASLSEFVEAKEYIESCFLTKSGKLDNDKPKVKEAIRRKADRIYGKTGISDKERNWGLAEVYTKMFYENIIPAVLSQKREKKIEKVLTVLKAFQFSKHPKRRLLVINCFEVALAIYFLDRDIILDLWKNSENDEFNEASITNEFDLPAGESITKPIGEYSDLLILKENKIIFNGLMTSEQKNKLLLNNPGKIISEAIKMLYYKSRIIHKETTL